MGVTADRVESGEDMELVRRGVAMMPWKGILADGPNARKSASGQTSKAERMCRKNFAARGVPSAIRVLIRMAKMENSE